MSNAKSPRPGLFILGMHRSGTSCLAGMLNCAGFNVGTVDEWNPDNRKGNREHLAVTPLNEGLLARAGGSWDHPPQGGLVVDKPHRREITSIIEGLEAGGTPWLIKDPRILLVPEPWLDLRGSSRRFGIFRHPLAVARSLQRRDNIEPNHAVELWSRYNQALLDLLHEQPFPLMLFTPDPGHLTKTVESVLARQFAEDISEGDVEPDKAGAFFSADLVHHDPDLLMDLEQVLADAGIDEETGTRANRIWQELVGLQNPNPLTLAEAPAVSSGQPTGKAESKEVTDPDLAMQRGQDPVPLIRDRIRQFEAHEDQQGLLEWLTGWQERLPDDPFVNWELARVEWARGMSNEAIHHCQEAVRLAPGWVVPLTRLAEWAEHSKNWKVATQSYRQLLSAHRSLASSAPRTAQLFFDHGEGFSGDNSITLPIETDGRHLELTFEAGELGRNVSRLRLDPANQQVVVTDLLLKATDSEGRVIPLQPTGDNALMQVGPARFYDTDDPQVLFNVVAEGMRDIAKVTASFRIAHADGEVPPAMLSALLEMRRQLSDAEALEQKLESLEEQLQVFETRLGEVRDSLSQRETFEQQLETLEERMRTFETLLGKVRDSLSARLGTGLTRTLMSPLSLGRGKTALDELDERWQGLEAVIRSLRMNRP